MTNYIRTDMSKLGFYINLGNEYAEEVFYQKRSSPVKGKAIWSSFGFIIAYHMWLEREKGIKIMPGGYEIIDPAKATMAILQYS